MTEMWPWLFSEDKYVLARAKSWKNRRKQKACREEEVRSDCTRGVKAKNYVVQVGQRGKAENSKL